MKGLADMNDVPLEHIAVDTWSWTQSAPYAQAVLVGSLILTCGVAPFDESGAIVGKGDFEVQFRQVAANLARLLAEAGSSLELIARQQVFLRRAEDLAEFRRLRLELYSPPYPASVTVVVTALAHPDMLIEIACEAVRHPSPSAGDAG
jgi:2-iminobutanoate/2-iminopropanoate deaminase